MKISMKTIQTLLLIIVVIFLSSEMSYSQYKEDAYRLSYLGTGIGARALGLGTAYVGVADDFSAAYWNPAGLGLIENNEISGGLSHFTYDNDNTFLGTKESFSSSSTNLDNFGIVYPFSVQRGHLVFAIGYERQSDFATALSFSGFNPNRMAEPIDGTDPGYRDSINVATNILEGGGINNWTVAGAIEAQKGLFVGASLSFIAGTYSYDRTFTGTDPYDVANLYRIDHQFTVTEDIGGVTGRIGLLYRTHDERGRIGLNVKFPSYLSMKDDYTDTWKYLDDTTAYDANGKSSNYSEFDVVTPFVFGAGLSWKFGDLLLAGSIEYTDWTQMEFRNTVDNWGNEENTIIKKDMKATTNLRLGAEFSIPNSDVALRGGFVYLPSPFKSQSSSAAQKYITGGLGWNIAEIVRLDLGYAYGFWDTAHDVSVDPPYTDYYPIATSEKISTHTVSVGLVYRF
jgi:long-subunit fatty acid transport protein